MVLSFVLFKSSIYLAIPIALPHVQKILRKGTWAQVFAYAPEVMLLVEDRVPIANINPGHISKLKTLFGVTLP
jgi:hypothetical protein